MIVNEEQAMDRCEKVFKEIYNQALEDACQKVRKALKSSEDVAKVTATIRQLKKPA